METINGVTFEEWAAASANIANGMSGEEVCRILEIEIPVWEQTNKQWGEKMTSLPMEQMMKYSEIFANPKVGRFATEGSTSSAEEVLKKVPNLDAYMKIQKHIQYAYEVGMDVDLEKEYGITTQEYGQVNMHFSKWVQENLHTDNNAEAMAEYNEADEKWDSYWKDFYKDKGTDLGGDIDF